MKLSEEEILDLANGCAGLVGASVLEAATSSGTSSMRNMLVHSIRKVALAKDTSEEMLAAFSRQLVEATYQILVGGDEARMGRVGIAKDFQVLADRCREDALNAAHEGKGMIHMHEPAPDVHEHLKQAAEVAERMEAYSLVAGILNSEADSFLEQTSDLVEEVERRNHLVRVAAVRQCDCEDCGNEVAN